MEDGAKLYNVIKVGKTEKAVFIDTVYPQYLSKEEAQKVYAARNPYNFETEVCDKVEKEFSVNSKEELINIIESRGYDSYIEKKFLSFAENLEIKTEENGGATWFFSSYGGVLELRRGIQDASCVGPGKSNLPFELRRKAGDCSRVTAGPIDLI